MTPDKDKALCEKYPKIFRDRNASMRVTAMCWGFSCGDGWYDLIDTLLLCIEGNLKPEQVVYISQIKEKFGTLRFYGHGGDDKIRAMIEFAESFSSKICEQCGSPGKTKGRGWYYTACAAHTKEGDHEDSDQ